MIGSADGRKFRNYAQQFTLDVLLGYANRHLIDLSRRYRLEQVQDALALMVVDQDMGDERRSVHSLSGAAGRPGGRRKVTEEPDGSNWCTSIFPQDSTKRISATRWSEDAKRPQGSPCLAWNNSLTGPASALPEVLAVGPAQVVEMRVSQVEGDLFHGGSAASQEALRFFHAELLETLQRADPGFLPEAAVKAGLGNVEIVA